MNKKIGLYSLKEIYQLTKLSFGQKLIKSVPKGLRITHYKIDEFRLKGVKISKGNRDLMIKYPINNLPFVFFLRKNSSDLLVFEQIILKREYFKIVSFFMKNNIPLENVIDAGANIGLTSIFIKSFFPDARIIALEPFDNNYNRMDKNFHKNGLNDIKAINKGIWGSTSFLAPKATSDEVLDWGFRLVETEDESSAKIEVISMTDLVKQFDLEFVDFLKIDIEGGEVSVFNNDSDLKWLNRVKVIALEIHDEYDCRTSIENTLRSFGFTLHRAGELTIGVNEKLVLYKFDELN